MQELENLFIAFKAILKKSAALCFNLLVNIAQLDRLMEHASYGM